jgi:hypothetical protein
LENVPHFAGVTARACLLFQALEKQSAIFPRFGSLENGLKRFYVEFCGGRNRAREFLTGLQDKQDWHLVNHIKNMDEELNSTCVVNEAVQSK